MLIYKKIHFWLLVLLLPFMSACSLQSKVPATAKYMLEVDTDMPKSQERGCKDKVLRMGLIESSTMLNSSAIYYRTDALRSYDYKRARWMDSVSHQVIDLMTQSIIKHDTFGSVVNFKSFAKNDHLLETNFYDFSQTLHEDGTSSVRMFVKLVLLEQYHRNIIDSKFIEIKIDGLEPNVEGAMQGYDQLTTKYIKHLNAFLDRNCQ